MELWQAPIWNSARRHSIDDDVTMFIGPDPNGNLVEVGVLATDDGPVIIHAMPGRMNRFFPR